MAFNMDIMRWLSEQRTEPMTTIFRFASDLGEIQGYVLICCIIFAAFSRSLAIRLIVIVTATMCANHILKMVIANPRPFVESGDYFSRWLVPPGNALELATEYSTPSGHAMAAAAFYLSLALSAQRNAISIICAVAILFTGLSRPYLGVHYVEDIILGWTIGLFIGWSAHRYATLISVWWKSLAISQCVLLLLSGSAALWLLSIAIDGGAQGHQPRAFLAYAGMLSGAAICGRLQTAAKYAADQGSVAAKAARFVLLAIFALALLEGLDLAAGTLAEPYSLAGYVLQYVRYLAVGLAALGLTPLIFTRMIAQR